VIDLFTVLLVLSGPAISAASPVDEPAQRAAGEQMQFFESKVRPLLADKCFRCHAGRQKKGGLRLDSLRSMLSGGESGPAIVPGKPEESLLVEAVNYESFEMPPTGQLPPTDVQILTAWIAAGAVWPESKIPVRAGHSGSDIFTADELNWWAFQPLRNVQPPVDVADEWVRNPIDAFTHARMSERLLAPAAEADAETLLRRAFFDLIGLPPTPTEVDAFLADDSPNRFEHLIDRLLDSPRYGERWARHWLDLVRYADSDGYRADFYRPSSWRYRDYVIQSLNDDKPWDRFVQEQLAGDELFPDDPDAFIATGYLRHGIYEYNIRDVRGQWNIILNEVTDTTGNVFLGMGMQCARCHDHKFDPILQTDYFALRAFFEPLQWRDDVVTANQDAQNEYTKQISKWEAATSKLNDQIDDITSSYRRNARHAAVIKFPADIQTIIAKPKSERSPLEQQLKELAWRQVLYEYERLDDKIKGDKKEQLLALRKKLSEHDQLKPAPMPTATGAGDISNVAPPTVIPKAGTIVEPGFLTVMAPPDPNVAPGESKTTGRRAALARWITDPNNPLTTRVMVNRIWQYHFGRGLAANSSDFGTLGGPPSHPDLLDWLTREFIGNGMQFKHLHRLIMTSATWRQSASHPRIEESQQIDPANRYCWRGNTRRLDAEQIRDAILSVTGQLDPTDGGPGVLADVPRRSIYLRVMRNSRDLLLGAFDLPLFFNSTASRDTTTSPIQSLVMFNSQTMLQHAAALAGSVDSASSPSERIANVWQRTLGRRPDSHELNQAMGFLQEHADLIRRERGDATLTSVTVGRLPYRDGQSILLEPGDGDTPRLHAHGTKQLAMTDFTVEAYIQVRSVYNSGAVRTIASRWNGSSKTAGWSFGVTGKGSRRKPQTLVIQIYGKDASGRLVEAAVFSDQHVKLNTPYYAAVSVRLGQGGDGSVTFFLKDLSNEDEQLQRATMSHKIQSCDVNALPVTVGTRASGNSSQFDGLIDDVRLSNAALSPESLLFKKEGTLDSTVAYWQFEPSPGLLQDSSGHGHHMSTGDSSETQLDPNEMAFVDFCHALLNSNQFLYVD
jgi:Protein of unknown function (DUF1549)/Protein of unknown function (DUF1553)/Planctomycete cytochrome C/Concanavalin A-like lectin/glucanases superfamily